MFASAPPGWENIVIDLVANGSGLVAVGMQQQGDASNANAAAWYSPNGHTWTRATVADGAGRTMDHIITTGAGFVAIGEEGYSFHAGIGLGTAIWTSPDGRSWARLAAQDAPPHGTALSGPVAWNGSFLAFASLEYAEGLPGPAPEPLTSGVWRSTDAVHWAPITDAPLGIGSLIAVSDVVVASGSDPTDAGHSPAVWRSANGTEWTRTPLPPPPFLPDGTSIYPGLILGGPAGLLILGTRSDDYSTFAWSSSDGLAWTPQDLRPVLAGSTIDRTLPVGGPILLVGRRADGQLEQPALWLLSQ